MQDDDQASSRNLPRTRPQRSSRTARRRARQRRGGRRHSGRERRERTPAGCYEAKHTRPRKRRGDPLEGRRDIGQADTGQERRGRFRRHGCARREEAPARGAGASGAPPAERRARLHAAAPRQGFECEGERASGPVQPPGGAELVASAAEIVGELAKAGLSTGERLLKDVFSRLPL